MMETLLKIKWTIMCFLFCNWIKMTTSFTDLDTFAHQYDDEEKNCTQTKMKNTLRLQFN